MCGSVKRSLKNKRRVDTQMKLCRTIAIRTDMCGCETCGMTSRGKSRLQAAEMSFLRSMIGITRRVKIRNDDIRNKLEELEKPRTTHDRK
jgi:hypothetical protein